MWFVHRKVPLLKKLFWSIVLLIPPLGWLAYAGCFKKLDSINTRCPAEHDWTGCGDGGGDGFGGGGHH
jgi:hypothetical protein